MCRHNSFLDLQESATSSEDKAIKAKTAASHLRRSCFFVDVQGESEFPDRAFPDKHNQHSYLLTNPDELNRSRDQDNPIIKKSCLYLKVENSASDIYRFQQTTGTIHFGSMNRQRKTAKEFSSKFFRLHSSSLSVGISGCHSLVVSG